MDDVACCQGPPFRTKTLFLSLSVVSVADSSQLSLSLGSHLVQDCTVSPTATSNDWLIKWCKDLETWLWWQQTLKGHFQIQHCHSFWWGFCDNHISCTSPSAHPASQCIVPIYLLLKSLCLSGNLKHQNVLPHEERKWKGVFHLCAVCTGSERGRERHRIQSLSYNVLLLINIPQ